MKVISLIAVVFLSWPSMLHAAPSQPNVLFIAIDDLNDWIGCLGEHPQVQTPNIDRLAARGTLFTNAHCQAPICGPSRASLLTGLYPWTNGVYQQPGKSLNDDTETFRGHLLPQYFEQHGYKTLGAGKITHGINHAQVFMEFGPRGSFGPKPENGFRFHYHLPDVPYSETQTDWGAFPDQDSEMPDHEIATWAVEQLGEKHEDPFFLAAGFFRPHVPFYVPQKWFEAYPLDTLVLPEVRIGDLDDVPEISRAIHELPKYPKLAWLQENDNEQLKLAVQAYLACISFVDHQVGRVLDALDASPYADNTTILLFSDHGYHLGEKDRISKQTLWEESTRVPLIVV
ncbi:MAG: sulfatase, partial [Verrucomicrobiota bacterium]